MDQIHKRLDELRSDFHHVYEGLSINNERAKLKQIEQELLQPEIWNNLMQLNLIKKPQIFTLYCSRGWRLKCKLTILPS